MTSTPSVVAGITNMVAPPALPGSPLVRAMVMKNAAPSAPVMNHFRPLTIQPPSTLPRSSSASSGPRRRPAPVPSSRRPNESRRETAAEGSVPAGPLSPPCRAGGCFLHQGRRCSTPAGRTGSSRPPRRPARSTMERPRPLQQSTGACGAKTPAAGLRPETCAVRPPTRRGDVAIVGVVQRQRQVLDDASWSARPAGLLQRGPFWAPSSLGRPVAAS